MTKVVLSLLRNHKKKTEGTKSLARMRKQAAWKTGVLEEILFSTFETKTKQKKVNKKSRHRNTFALFELYLYLSLR